MSKRINTRKKPPEKFQWVRNHLQRYGVLDSFRAIELFDVTRLAAYIHRLKNKKGIYRWKIKTVDIETRNPSGRYGVHAKYVLISIPKSKK
jgi:hypothetical protein